MVSPLDLPRRLAASVGNSIDAAAELPVFQQKVLEHLTSLDEAMSRHLSSMDDGIQGLRELIVPMREDIADVASRAVELERVTGELERRVGRLEGSAGEDLSGQLTETNDAMRRVEALVARISERIPDPDAPGPIAKAKEAITGE